MSTEVITTLIDDYDGESEATETVVFGLDGHTYEVDLNDEHAADLREHITQYAEVGRLVSGPKRPRKSGKKQKTDAAAVRAWAVENGYEIGNRGRIAPEIIAAYKEAQEA